MPVISHTADNGHSIKHIQGQSRWFPYARCFHHIQCYGSAIASNAILAPSLKLF